ncbi:MAG TPA: SPASM domain-containing protein, partial [Telmatospirillum sp.]|nr:SPASM domain-containing protein [Telmatospirillum sp.]
DDGVLYRVTPWSVLPESYGAFLCEVFDEWLREDVGRIFVQFFDSQLGASMGLSAGLCWFSETCGQNLALEHNGDLFACDHYVYPDYKRGNILETSLRALANQPEQLRFGIEKRETLPRQCRDCPVRFSCNGGCPKHRFLKTADGESGLNYFCRSQTRFLRHAGPTLQLMADLIRSGRSAADAMALVKASRRRSGVTALRMEEPQRNSPCPCGSGRKFKVCCGRTDSTNLR